MSFIAGPFSATVLSFDGSTSYGSIGVVEKGFNLTEVQEGEPIQGDNLGKSDQDGVYQGGNCFLSFVASEVNNAPLNRLLYPQDSAGGTLANRGIVGYPGELWSFQAYRITMTALYATTGAFSFEKNYYIYAARLANRHALEKLLMAGHRKLPVRLQCFPVSVSSVNRWYSTDNA